MPTSVFQKDNISKVVKDKISEIKKAYLADSKPWVIGYSGGKDSTVITQLIWMALSDLPKSKRKKDVHVITTDTLVENPIVSNWVEASLDSMRDTAKANALPIKPNLIRPALDQRFWVNLIGRGYPSPRRGFRWCTDRLKIRPTNQFIEDQVSEHNEVVLVLGVRSAESAQRAKSVKKFSKDGKLFSKHQSLKGCFVYSPIADWTNDDVWLFLMKHTNPWNHSNEELLNLYQGATEDNECPVVVDTSTQSCGSSRFGCWVCTLVTQDKSMTAMIHNDSKKEWMMPLLKFREEIDFHQKDGIEKDRANREFTRMKGQVSYYENKHKEIDTVPGPYKKSKRLDLLEKLLIAETQITSQFESNGTGQVVKLITHEELEEIRRIWIEEKNELEDEIPAIYKKIKGKTYQGKSYNFAPVLNSANLDLLKSLCIEEREYELTRNLLVKEMKLKSKGVRRGFINELEKELDKFIYFDKSEALEAAHERQEIIKTIDINPINDYEGIKY